MNNSNGTADLADTNAYDSSKPLDDSIIQEIKERLVEESDIEVSVEDIQLTWSLRDDLGMDSMQAVSLSLDLEDALSISLDDDDLTKLETVGDLFKIVQEKLALAT
jgi:acyl carrier protein